MSTPTLHQQHPLDTGFTAASTAEDVLAEIDLSGRNIVITGGHSGLGLEATRTMARAGASVTVAVRDPQRAAAVVAGIERVETSQLDLADPESVNAFARRWLDTGRALHVLINNAGVMGGPLVRDARGYESHLATNHLGHFQLTNALYPALRTAQSARVVNATSGAHRLSDIIWDDPNFDTTEYTGHLGYAQSMTAKILFAVELDRRWSADGIRGYAAHPGIIMGTNIGPARANGETANAPLPMEELQAMGLFDAAGEPVIAPEHGLKTPQQGSSTMVFGATSPLLNDVSGVYLKDNDVSPVDPTPPTAEFDGPPPMDVAPHAIDPESARRFWALSEQLLDA